jgi:hypothetical protein
MQIHLHCFNEFLISNMYLKQFYAQVMSALLNEIPQTEHNLHVLTDASS